MQTTAHGETTSAIAKTQFCTAQGTKPRPDCGRIMEGQAPCENVGEVRARTWRTKILTHTSTGSRQRTVAARVGSMLSRLMTHSLTSKHRNSAAQTFALSRWQMLRGYRITSSMHHW